MEEADVIRWAREAGWDDHHAEFDTRIKRFAALVAAAERERAAKVCEAMRPAGGRAWSPAWFEALSAAAENIRALKDEA